MDTRLRGYDDSGGCPGMTLGGRGRRSGSGSLGGHCGVRGLCTGQVAGQVTEFAAGGGSEAVEGDHVVDLGPDADPLTDFVVVVAGHMGHHRFTTGQTQGI